LTDLRRAKAIPKKSVSYRYPKGFDDWMREGSRPDLTLHDIPIRISGQRAGISVEIHLQYEASINCRIISFVNSYATAWGSAEIEGLLAGLSEAINSPCFGERSSFSGDDTRQGLTCLVAVRLRDPRYGGATKERLINPEVRDLVHSLVVAELGRRFKACPELHLQIWLHLDDIRWVNQEAHGSEA